MESLKTIEPTQTKLVPLWHKTGQLVKSNGLSGLVEKQHFQNFLLWHEEDIARIPHVPDSEIARVKKSIDILNQERNDLIEKLDEAILARMIASGIRMPEKAPLNSETPGSMIDRCSIMALKIFHMQEQTERKEVSESHIQTALQKVAILKAQRRDLFQCLFALIQDVQKGERKFKIYRQFKMYNDPTLNPEIYGG